MEYQCREKTMADILTTLPDLTDQELKMTWEYIRGLRAAGEYLSR